MITVQRKLELGGAMGKTEENGQIPTLDKDIYITTSLSITDTDSEWMHQWMRHPLAHFKAAFFPDCGRMLRAAGTSWATLGTRANQTGARCADLSGCRANHVVCSSKARPWDGIRIHDVGPCEG